MAWRAAASLLALRDQVNAAWPNRSRVSDGTVGDARHRSRASDHNPWIRDGNMGVVSSLDITHDPKNGSDAGKIAAAIRRSRDNRVKYIIWNRRISNSSPTGGEAAWAWRPYGGKNPHSKHMHISVKSAKSRYDSAAPWHIGASSVIADPVAPEPAQMPYLRRGSRSRMVKDLQALLIKHGQDLKRDGRFGEATELAVKAFQRKVGLVQDGEVGPKTWAALMVA